MIDERGLKTRIEIDGGIDADNIRGSRGAGAEIIVSGSAIFGADDPGSLCGSCARRLSFGCK
jgi:ribulose-phosphate 3-epimerase